MGVRLQAIYFDASKWSLLQVQRWVEKTESYFKPIASSSKFYFVQFADVRTDRPKYKIPTNDGMIIVLN